MLLQKFDNNTFANTLGVDTWVLHDHPFVKITAFGPDFYYGDGEGKPIEWGGRRAWFDEQKSVEQLREKLDQCSSESCQSDSYMHSDFEQWGELDCQKELSSSMTVGVDDTGLPPLPLIVDVEMSDELRFMY
ncbi:hypothetical protein BDR04DRAFT_1097343 [Suillus decipiens]|nr:hypothetical protein BDR04DRAFT_1097343 [Suillus decipiens]